MKFRLLLFTLFKFVEGGDENEDMNVMIRIVGAILEVHHFGFYMLLQSNETNDELFHVDLLKLAKRKFKYSSVIQVRMEEYEEYVNKSYEDFSRFRCLKIINGKSEKLRRKFAEFSKKLHLGGMDVWLLFLDKKIAFEEYLNTLVLPFNVQLITAVMDNSTYIHFRAPYRVSESHPLRIQDVGHWTADEGLKLPNIAVALTRKDMEGVFFRAGTMNNEPMTWIYKNDKGGYTAEGFFIDMWQELSESLNFTYSWLPSVDGGAGSLNSDGTWNGLIGMVLRGELDVAVEEFTITLRRKPVIEFSVPILTTAKNVFFTKSGHAQEWGSLLKPFSKETWLAIIAWLVVGGIAFSLFYSLSCRYEIEDSMNKHEFINFGSFFVIFQAFTSQGNDWMPRSAPCRIIFCAAYLMTGILLPAYSAALISYIAVNIPARPFNSLDEMMKVGTHKLMAARGSAEYAYFSDAKNPKLQKVYETLIKPIKNEDLPANTPIGMEKVCKQHNFAYYGPDSSSRFYAEYYSAREGCSIMTFEQNLGYLSMAMVYPKKSPYRLVIDRQLQKMVHTGLLDKWERLTWRSNEEIKNVEFEPIELVEAITERRRMRNNRLRLIQCFPMISYYQM